MTTSSAAHDSHSEFFGRWYGEAPNGNRQRVEFAYTAPHQGTILHQSGSSYAVKLRGEQTGGTMTLLEVVVPPDVGSPLHIHHREDEIVTVVEGVLRVTAGDRILSAGPGACLYLPRGTTHRFENATSLPARLLVAFTPSGLEKMLAEAGQPATDGAHPSPPTPADMERLRSVAPRYGYEVLSHADSSVRERPRRLVRVDPGG